MHEFKFFKACLDSCCHKTILFSLGTANTTIYVFSEEDTNYCCHQGCGGVPELLRREHGNKKMDPNRFECAPQETLNSRI